MKETNYTDKNGNPGTSYGLEVGDVFTSKCDKPKEFQGKYTNYSLAAVYNGKDIFINLSKGQADFFNRNEIKPDTELIATSYTNDYGTFVGVGFKNAKSQEERVANTPSEQTIVNPGVIKSIEPVTGNLLQQPSNNLLSKPVVTMDSTETDIYNQIKMLGKTDITEASFVDTMVEMAHTTKERAKEIWDNVWLKG